MKNLEQIYNIYKECNYQVSTDTRKNVEGSLFFCLSGKNFNGNDFAQTALAKGAKYVVVDSPSINLPNAILVDDCLKTLQNLSSLHRKTLQIPIIAITGSNGKTTTKELIFSVLNQEFKVSCTQGNLNNHIGVPLTLLSFTPKTDIGIVEMGANNPNEIDFLCQIAQPDFGYITNFGKAHLEGFISVEGVIKAKSELYDYLKNNKKVIFFNNEDIIQLNKAQDYEHSYSFSTKNNKKANVLVNVKDKFPFLSIIFESITIKSNLIGIYNTDNIAIAITLGRYFGLSVKKIKDGIESYIPSNSRSQIIERDGTQNKILLDAYNANPSSMKAAIDNFIQVPYDKKVVILGDMKELGAETEREHQVVVNQLEIQNWEAVFLVGENFCSTQNNFTCFEDTQSLFDYLLRNQFTDSFFLIKGSRAMRLETILPSIK